MTGAQSTRHWAENALWYDIPPFASKGVQPAIKMFDKAFSSFQCLKVDILETETFVSGDMGIVCIRMEDSESLERPVSFGVCAGKNDSASKVSHCVIPIGVLPSQFTLIRPIVTCTP